MSAGYNGGHKRQKEVILMAGFHDIIGHDDIIRHLKNAIETGKVSHSYIFTGEAGSGMICLNGAAARQVAVGDHVILMCYAQMTPEEAKEHHPKVVFVDADNHIARVTNYEKHGKLTDDFIGA